MFYKHKKSGNLYEVLAMGVDCTNSRDGTSVVIYCPIDNEDSVYVREESEFKTNFELQVWTQEMIDEMWENADAFLLKIKNAPMAE